MKTYKVELEIRAECESDAEELLNDYTGAETHLEIKEIEESQRTIKIIVEGGCVVNVEGLKEDELYEIEDKDISKHN